MMTDKLGLDRINPIQNFGRTNYIMMKMSATISFFSLAFLVDFLVHTKLLPVIVSSLSHIT
jgi:hypothetical protein